jgi:hypothetical protein
MDAGVVSGLLQVSRPREAQFEKKGLRREVAASKRPATASGCGGAGPSAASPLLPDAQRHRLRRGSLQPTPRRSQRRSTPFFSTLLMTPADDAIEKLLDEMIGAQRRRLLELAARIQPGVSSDDLFQPHDHPALAGHPQFNFEDGILAGYLAVRAALRASR